MAAITPMFATLSPDFIDGTAQMCRMTPETGAPSDRLRKKLIAQEYPRCLLLKLKERYVIRRLEPIAH